MKKMKQNQISQMWARFFFHEQTLNFEFIPFEFVFEKIEFPEIQRIVFIHPHLV